MNLTYENKGRLMFRRERVRGRDAPLRQRELVERPEALQLVKTGLFGSAGRGRAA